MINHNKKMSTEQAEEQMIQLMMESLAAIYSVKSSDEYKSHGDITVSSEYKRIEEMVSNLKTIKKFPTNEADNIKTLFLTLHRPVFKKMVVEYIAEPNEANTLFTALYTVGFRVLIGELSRIYASTEATSNGIVYKPGKISSKNDTKRFIASFNTSLEKRINDYIKSSSHIQEGFVTDVSDTVTKILPKVKDGIKKVFSSIRDINPISLINTAIMYSYDSTVKSFDEISELYKATYEAYKEYMRIPDTQRNSKVEAKYLKNMERYKIQMDDLKATLEHYDKRASDDVKDAMNDKSTKTTKSTVDTSNDNSTSSDNDDYGF